MVFCNTTLENLSVDQEERYGVGLTFHEIGLIICAVFGLIAIGIANFMIFQHAIHYLRPEEQKHIIRILLMIPIYATVSFLSYYYYLHTIYFDVLRDCYEAFAIASFFTLICNYIAPDLHAQKDYFRTITTKNWIFPIPWLQKCTGGMTAGFLRKPASGLTWFNIIYVCIFQYCFIRVLFTIVSVASEASGRYCTDSLSPAFAHIWVMCFEGVSVTIAMYALIQFYYQIYEEIREHKPFLKILCIKLVIFFSFWQTLVISFLTSHGTISTGKHIAYPDISVGLPSMLLCIEMAMFAIMHIFAFSWRPYQVGGANAKSRNNSSTSYEQGQNAINVSGSGYSGKPEYTGGFLGFKALAEAFNPWDIIKASARGFRWLFVGARHRRDDSSYKRQVAVEPLGMELDDRAKVQGGMTNGPSTLHVPSQPGRPLGPGPLRGPPGQSGGYGEGAYSREASPYRGGANLASPAASWHRDADDDEAWRPTIVPDEDSRRPSPDLEDQAALLRHAGRLGMSSLRDEGA